MAETRNGRRSWRRVLGWLGGGMVALLIAAELFARFYLGLGDPPLWMADPEIEYLMQPSREYRRVGRVSRYNAYSMRSDDFPRRKSEPGEFRVMVFGDSVVNGGVLSDQSRLATTLLQQELSRVLGRKVVVGNISAGSWGPPNLLAYAKRFGFFDADVAVLVFNSEDCSDVPVPGASIASNPTMPTKRPCCAVAEAITRYLPGYLPARRENAAPRHEPGQAEIDQSLGAIRDFAGLAASAGVKLIAAQHLDRNELDGGKASPGHAAIGAVLNECGIATIQLGPAFAAARRSGQEPYRDFIHPNDVGQRILAEALLEAVVREVR